jgi:hypothetical protein
MTSLVVAATLVGITLHVYNLVNQSGAAGPNFNPANPHRQFGIWDSIVIPSVNGASDDDENAKPIADEIEEEKKDQTPGHHTIPVYLCGAMAQKQLPKIPYADHVLIHGQIAGIWLTLNAAQLTAYKTLGYQRKWEVLKLAQTDDGRGAIAGALSQLYQTQWWGIGIPTIGTAFTAEAPGYIAGTNTSLPSCTRYGSP